MNTWQALTYIIKQGPERYYDFSWDQTFQDEVLPVLRSMLARMKRQQLEQMRQDRRNGVL